MLDLTGQEYYVSSMGATESGTENIVRLNAGLTVRLFDRHALGVRYIIIEPGHELFQLWPKDTRRWEPAASSTLSFPTPSSAPSNGVTKTQNKPAGP